MRIGDVVQNDGFLGLVVHVDDPGCHCHVVYCDGGIEVDSVSFIEAQGRVLRLTTTVRAIVNAAIAAEALRRME